MPRPGAAASRVVSHICFLAHTSARPQVGCARPGQQAADTRGNAELARAGFDIGLHRRFVSLSTLA
jgi:hypothetical protein